MSHQVDMLDRQLWEATLRLKKTEREGEKRVVSLDG